MRTPALLFGLLLLTGCASSEPGEDPGPPVVQRVANLSLEREGFRLLHPETWSVDADEPGYDPDRYFFLEGPPGASVAFMLLDEPADPAALVEGMAAGHGFERVRSAEFEEWGRYRGAGVDLHGIDADGVRGGLRAFAWSSEARSFLVVESYLDDSYAAARGGFEAIEMSFALQGTDEIPWPEVSLGTPTRDRQERILVRSAFQLRFPDTWSVDYQAEDYDPDRFFTLLSPYDSCWVLIQLFDGVYDADQLLGQAAAGLRDVLSTVEAEEALDRWGPARGGRPAPHGARERPGGQPDPVRARGAGGDPARDRVLVRRARPQGSARHGADPPQLRVPRLTPRGGGFSAPPG